MQSSSASSPTNQELAERIFAVEGELAQLCRTKDWASTPLGPLSAWPVSLRAVAGLVVAAPEPMIVLWGEELVQIYNDKHRALMGKKHPGGLGQPTRECWPEVWEFNGPVYEGVMQRRESHVFENQLFTIERHGYPEEAYFTLAYSPVFDDVGEVGGVLVTVTETTASVQRAEAQQAQRESEERLGVALEAAELGAWDLDLVTDNASVRTLRHDQIFGYSELQADWGAKVAMRHVLEEDRPIMARAFARAEETGVLAFEVRVRWPNDSVHWISVLGRTHYDDDGKPVRMAGVVADVTDRNRAEALRQSEERFRLMADALPQIIWMTDAEGKVELFNKQWFAYTGQPHSPTVKEQIPFTRLHPDDVPITARFFDQGRQNGRSFSVEHRIRAATGDYRWFESFVEPSIDPGSGQINHWIGMSVDVHDRKLNEARLRQAAELNAFRVSLDSALRPLGDPLDIQQAASRVLGQYLNASRILYGEISSDGDYVTVAGGFRNGVPHLSGRFYLLDFGPTLVAEFKAGRTLTVNDVASDSRLSEAEKQATAAINVAAHTAVPLIKGGRTVAIFVAHQNTPRNWNETEITLMEETAERTWAAVERAKAEKALRRNEAKYRTLFNSIDQGFGVTEIIFDDAGEAVDFRWVETNPAFERHTGFATSGAETILELIPDLEQHWIETYARVERTGEPTRFVEGVAALDRWFDVYACPIGDPEQHRVAVLFTDITERRKAEQASQEANARLVESDRRKDEFLAMLAHELRNPLAAIANTVKLLERSEAPGVELDSEGGTYLPILKRQTNVLRGLVDDLLDVSRITRGLVELKSKRLDVNIIAERALESCQALMDEKGHEVSVMLPRKPLYVKGDPVRLEQVVVNLLTNAAKYTDPGGRIVLSVERNEQNVELRVRDTGIGMTAEVLQHIFELFGQAERGLARSEGGLGIGLTIVKNLVELHGGVVTAESEGTHCGATFTITLPLARAAAKPQEPIPAEVKPQVTSKRVMVVEDSHDIAETMVILLELSGHQVLHAQDGPTALDKVASFQPDVVLLDIGLPGMDGYEVARMLRQHPQAKQAVLAALTGYGQPDDVKRATEAGFNRHFIKPVSIEALEAFINESAPAAG